MTRMGVWAVVAMLCWMAGTALAKVPEDPRLRDAQAAFDEATKLKGAGQLGEALSRAGQALALREAALGGAHPDVASCLDLMGTLHRWQGQLTQAEPLIRRALALREAALGKDHLDVAHSLNNLANLHAARGAYDQAEPLYLRVIAIREAAPGSPLGDIAQAFNNLAILYGDQGLYDRAEPLHQRALVLREAALGKDHPDVAQSLNNLAILHGNRGAYHQAVPLHERALALREAALGKDHPDVAQSLNNLANLYSEQMLNHRAEPLYRRALTIWETSLGDRHRYVAAVRHNLATLYVDQGLYGSAEPLLQRALTVQEAALGKNHPEVAQTLNSLAGLYWKQGLYGRAEVLHQRALAIREAALGKNHRDVARTLNNLAILYYSQRMYRRAEPLYLRALAIWESALGPGHDTVAEALNDLAALYADQGMYRKAEPLYLRAIDIRKAALGERHPHVGHTLNDLARLRLAQHRLSDALPIIARAFAISEQHLREEALDFSESRLAHFLQSLQADEQLLYALPRAYPGDAGVRRLALGAALLRKGRSVEEIANISRAIYRKLGPEDRTLLERLRSLRTRRATLSLGGPGKRSNLDHQQLLKTLADEGDALEADLARRSAPLRALTGLPPPAEVVDRVAASLPSDSALVELVTYEDRPLVSGGGVRAPAPAPLRYLALVLFPDGSTRSVDLGPAEPIDRAATRLRNALALRDARFQSAAQALHRLAFRPLQPLLGKVRRVFLSPDGQLGLVPFAALHDGRRFLLDSFDFTYLTSGKDLLPRLADRPLASSVVVLADPDFQAAPGASLPDAPTAERSASLARFFSASRAEELAGISWAPLPGSRQEAESIQQLLPEAQVFLGPEASKQRLLQLPTPGVLHLATHGFFLEDAPVPKDSRAVVTFGALGDDAQAGGAPDPLLRSGLMLAGASARAPDAAEASRPPPEDAVVTALELAGLDLWGTQLVVLSACDTGRGDVKRGQGVFGLRRAFVVAGAQTVVMSLWKVSDAKTGALMAAYYRNLLAGQGRSSALREAMRELRMTQAHPHYWAPFISVGSDAPLRAVVPHGDARGKSEGP
jgi:CHAT domain-containing protein/Tfp pilus assembly protein PilF